MDGRTFHIVNLGCKVNRVEADAIAAALMATGGVPVSQEDAELIVVNTCTVTGEADKKARKAVRHALSVNPIADVVVTGCAVAIDESVYSSMDPRVKVVQRADMMVRAASLSNPSTLRYGDGFRTRVNLKVQDGCDRACTYCIVHVARGKAVSTPFGDVIDEARAYLVRGVKEIVLTGIDLASYRSQGEDLASLCAALVEEADAACPEGDVPARVRVSSIEPHTIDERFVDVLAQADGRICRHLHLPLQSGSTKVLGEMNRPYTAASYGQLVDHLYDLMPTLALTTDIICGFPGETDEEFAQTIELARRCRFSKIHVFPYSKRTGTPAALRTDQVDPQVKAARAARLRNVGRQLRADDLLRRAHTCELAIVEGATALTESYHEVAAPEGAVPGALVPIVFGESEPPRP